MIGSFLLHDLLAPVAISVDLATTLAFHLDPVRVASLLALWALIVVPSAGIAPRRRPPVSRLRIVVSVIAVNVLYLAIWRARREGRQGARRSLCDLPTKLASHPTVWPLDIHVVNIGPPFLLLVGNENNFAGWREAQCDRGGDREVKHAFCLIDEVSHSRSDTLVLHKDLNPRGSRIHEPHVEHAGPLVKPGK